MRKQRIIDVINSELKPEVLFVENESDSHQGPPGRETHFKLIIVSDLFEGQTRIERHQLVYKYMQKELDTGLHALALKLFTAPEWSEKKDSVNLSSPDCSHKKK